MNLYELHTESEDLYGYEQSIKIPEIAYNYLSETVEVDDDLLEKAEDSIATSAEYSYRYAADILLRRFKEGEPAIATSAAYSLSYALHVINGRFLAGEETMKQDEDIWHIYTRNFMKHGEL